MRDLAKLVTHGTPSSGLLFRDSAYGSDNIGDFLRDVLSLANAAVSGYRYIVCGVGEDSVGRRQLRDIPVADFERKPGYASVIAEHIEPAVRIRYLSLKLHDKQLGVFEIGDCAEKPYMMRIDYSETLRRGDAYGRVNDSIMKLGRRQLQALFEKHFRDAVSSDTIEIGFSGDFIRKDCSLATSDLDGLPSNVASAKLQELLAARDKARKGGNTSMVARLTHARLFGSDSPYEHRSPAELREEMSRIRDEYLDQDQQYLFEEHGEQLQMVVYNQGEEPLRDASLTVVLPKHDDFYVAEQLPKLMRGHRLHDRPESDQSSYPQVSVSDEAIQVTSDIGDIPPGELVESFARPLRVCAGGALQGRRIGLQYVLSAANLRKPAKGKLRLLL